MQQPKRSAEVESARGYGGKQKPGLGAEKQAHAIARKIPEGQIARVLAERNNPSFLAAAVQANRKAANGLGMPRRNEGPLLSRDGPDRARSPFSPRWRWAPRSSLRGSPFRLGWEGQAYLPGSFNFPKKVRELLVNFC